MTLDGDGNCALKQTDTSGIEATFAFCPRCFGRERETVFWEIGFVGHSLDDWLRKLVYRDIVPAKQHKTEEACYFVANKNCDDMYIGCISNRHYLCIDYQLINREKDNRVFAFSTTKPKVGNKFECKKLLNRKGYCQRHITGEVLSEEIICKNIYRVKTTDGIYYVMVRNLAE